MPSFDVVSEVDKVELRNAVEQAQRDIDNRFDFKGTSAAIEQTDDGVRLTGDADFQLEQILDLFTMRLAKRGVDVSCLDVQESKTVGKGVQQLIVIREGIDTELGKKIQKKIKDSKLKVQASIQGDQLRVTGKKRDDLQAVIAMLKAETFDRPLQYQNFRD
ncbi:MAG: YajQ family cyclic di-GMP-binding protein [Thioalkalivibrionaceae bacterium]